MSLFPSRIKRGEVLTIHLGLQPKTPTWMHNRIYVIDPHGVRTLCFDRLQLFFPSSSSSEAKDAVEDRSMGRPFQSAPLLMAARFLQNDNQSTAFFVQALKRLRDSTHLYVHYRVPEEAPLGRYRVELESSCEGETRGSGSAASDYFFVEELKVRGVTRNGDRQEAVVENASTECVLARLFEGDLQTFGARELMLPPQARTTISFRDQAFLAYLGGSEVLRLGASDDPLVIRNPSLVAIPKAKDLVYVFSTQNKSEQGYELNQEYAKIWAFADGFRCRSLIRTKANAGDYEEMLERGLIIETSDPITIRLC